MLILYIMFVALQDSTGTSAGKGSACKIRSLHMVVLPDVLASCFGGGGGGGGLMQIRCKEGPTIMEGEGQAGSGGGMIESFHECSIRRCFLKEFPSGRSMCPPVLPSVD